MALENEIIAQVQAAKKLTERTQKLRVLRMAKAILDGYITQLSKKDLS
jgi:hypothetical protein